LKHRKGSWKKRYGEVSWDAFDKEGTASDDATPQEEDDQVERF